jgi:hypothetical protein
MSRLTDEASSDPGQRIAERWGVAVHEAGHAIAAIHLGRKLVDVVVRDDGTGTTSTEPWRYSHPILGRRDGRIGRIRKALVFCVAGSVAEALGGGWWSGILSERIRHDKGNDDPHGDYLAAVAQAKQILEGLSLLRLKVAFEAGDLKAGDHVDHTPRREDIAAEVGRAERRALGILTRRWPEVLKLAGSLCRRKSGRITARQVKQLLAIADGKEAS